MLKERKQQSFVAAMKSQEKLRISFRSDWNFDGSEEYAFTLQWVCMLKSRTLKESKHWPNDLTRAANFKVLDQLLATNPICSDGSTQGLSPSNHEKRGI